MAAQTILDNFRRLHHLVVYAIYLIAIIVPGLSASDSHRDINNHFDSVPTTYKTILNATVILPCHHITSQQHIRWIRHDVVLVDTRQPDLLPPERITLFDNGSLQVSNVTDMDTAEYVCEVGTSDGVATQTHAIEVQHAPTVLSSPSGTVEVEEGSVFEIVCEARGVPHPIISWRHQGRRLDAELNNDRRLIVNVKDRHMAGAFECVAKNGFGEASAGVTLVVQFAPEIKATTNIVHSKIALRANLECIVNSQPAASVHWFHNGFPIVTHGRFVQQTSDLSINETRYHSHSKHVLQIKRVQDTDLGIYECRASNKLGTMGAQLELTGRPMPSVFRPSPKANTPMTHNLIWQTESLSPLIEYILRFRQVPSGNVTPHNRQGFSPKWNHLVIPSEEGEGPIHTIGYNLRGLMPASVYEVSVTARNRYGISDSSLIKRFATGGEIEIPNYSTEAVDYARLEAIAEDIYSTTDSFENAIQPESGYSDYSVSGQRQTEATSSLFVIGCAVSLIVWLSPK